MKKLLTYAKTIVYYVIIVFISYTLMNKLLQVESFQLNIAKTGVFSNHIIKPISYFILIIETISIVLLIFFKKQGILYSLIMFITFTLYIIYLYFLKKYEVCGCGGVLNGLSFEKHLLINVSLIFLTIFIKTPNENK